MNLKQIQKPIINEIQIEGNKSLSKNFIKSCRFHKKNHQIFINGRKQIWGYKKF